MRGRITTGLVGISLLGSAVMAWAGTALPTPADQPPAMTTAPAATTAGLGTDLTLNTAPVSAAAPAGAGANASFSGALHGVFPLTPQQILQTEKSLDATRAAIHSAIPPVMQTGTVALDLTPGATVPVVNITPGYVSSIVFLDSSGAPWPITSVTVGDPAYFTVQAPKVTPRNLLTVAAMGSHLSSNIAVTLADHTTPVMLTLETNPSTAAVLTALRANAPGPLAKSPVFENLKNYGANTTLLGFLDNIPPQGAVEMTTRSPGIQAWVYQRSLYVRTRLIPVWPAWVASVRGELGVHVYQMPNVSSIMVVNGGSRESVDFHPPHHIGSR